ncbi:MAG: hypothetical protein CVU05_11650 [Bacteroidetes bacterium HGW-Bacteroidetes-21]|jgi:hypothetical protein|nr:MAG: hypothetical protein CVU05_11650 [Bacteroidetes bacterium HGW-Bacteroidetes-21]
MVNSMKYLFPLFALLLLFSLKGLSQETSSTSEDIIENFIEEVTASTDQELDYTSIYEDLNFYLSNPLNLNEATMGDLEKLYILTEYQMKNILYYRDQYGSFYTVYELVHLGGFNANLVKMILPFITVEKVEPFLKFKPSQALKYGSNQVFLRSQSTLEQAKGYSDATPEELLANPNARYLGSPIRLYAKYKYSYKSYLNWGVTAEKDPGEEFFKGTQKNGFDYYTAHFFARKIGPAKAIAIGDFNAQFGQGLVLFNGFGYGKSTMVLDIRKRAQGLKPYSGSDENLFFRGGGTTLSYKDVDFTIFFSHKNKDANVTGIDSISNSPLEISSLQTSGLHRTPSELEDRHSITENVYGAHLQYNHKKFKIGATGITYNYSADLVKSTQPYNQFAFSGSSNSNAGIDYQASIRDLTIFGETAISENGAMATVNGAMFSLSPQMSMAMLHRYYEKDYQALFASSFGENSTVSNEKGFYIGTILYPANRLKLSAYYDMYFFPWLRFGVDAPSHGTDYIVQAEYALSRYVNINMRFKQEIKPENTLSTDLTQSGIEDVNTTKIRFHISYKVSRTIECKNRMEWAIIKRTNVNYRGFLIYHDISYKPTKLPLTFSARYAIFDTDSWESRLYAYESDILYSFSIPAYYDKGTRVYFNVKYAINKRIDLWFRISQTYFANVQSISTGLDAIDGKTKTEAKIQLRVRI